LKFTKKLSIIIESGFLGSNLKFTDFNFNPKNPNNLKDLGNYIIMMYQILYAERNGLQKYTKQKLSLEVALVDNKLTIEPILNEFINLINLLLNKEIKLVEVKKQINQKNKFDISTDLFTAMKKKFIIEFKIGSHMVGINPFNNNNWIINVLHDPIHIVINPKTVSKFSNKNYGDFINPIGYSNKELLEEIPALITDVNISNLNEFDIEEDDIKKIKDTGKIVNFPKNKPDSIMFTFFLNILRNTIIFNYLKSLDTKSVKEFLKNPKSINKEILNKQQKVKWDDIKSYFKKYPYFQNILDRTKNILIKNKAKGITADEVLYDEKYFNNNFYYNVDNIIYEFMQKSHRFLTKKNEKIGKDEGKLGDFLQHVKNCINNYNKTIK
jgi:hypothetical protein